MIGRNMDREKIIAELKKEVNELRQNEKDYQDLNFLLTNLEHRYDVLAEEKNQMEKDFAETNQL